MRKVEPLELMATTLKTLIQMLDKDLNLFWLLTGVWVHGINTQALSRFVFKQLNQLPLLQVFINQYPRHINDTLPQQSDVT